MATGGTAPAARSSPPSSGSCNVASLQASTFHSRHIQNFSRKLATLPHIPPGSFTKAPGLRIVPSSPLQVHVLQDKYAQPSNADVAHTEPRPLQSQFAHRKRPRHSRTASAATVENAASPKSPISPILDDGYDLCSMGPQGRIQTQRLHLANDGFNKTMSTDKQHISVCSSTVTNASSLLGGSDSSAGCPSSSTSNCSGGSPLPSPQSSCSSTPERSRSRGPTLGTGHLGSSPSQSRKSSNTKLSSYTELLSIPYPQQAVAPIVWDNSRLRGSIGHNASLLSTLKTLEMYRQNLKKTKDFAVQYSFAMFLISTAKQQGLDASNPKAGEKSPSHFQDLDSSLVGAAVMTPHQLVQEARQILQRLANGGYPFAQYYLADGFTSGLFNNGEKDYNAAFPLFVLAAKHGHAESAYRTGVCYEFGWGCRKDAAKAIQYLRTAAAKRHPGAMSRLGKACLSGDLGEKRYREGIKWLRLATDAADTQYNAAPYQLGCLYETGYGDDIFMDVRHAVELFTRAADLGHPEANFRMGDVYKHGQLNCRRDPALSVRFYTIAAGRGHAAAMMGLCTWYIVGVPLMLEKDEGMAYKWARRSAERGFVKAKYACGYFNEMGIGCRRDKLAANLWYLKAANAGDERAKQRVATIQAAVKGRGTIVQIAPSPNGKLVKSAKRGQDNKDCAVM